MPRSQPHIDLGRLRKLVLGETAGRLPDGQLLERFAARREEAAFEALLERHAPMVWGVCRRLLRRHHDAEDAFQATFLVLARNVASIRRHESLAAWLHGVAYRIALRARAAAGRNPLDAPAALDAAAGPPAEAARRELCALLDEELHRLPEKYRAPLVLCHLEGRTRDEAALQLGCSLAVVKGRLEQGRERLRRRLARRGLTLSGVLLAGALGQEAALAAAPAGLAQATLRVAAGKATAGALSAPVAALTEGAIRALLVARLRALTAALLLVGAAAVGAGVMVHRMVQAETADAPTPRQPNPAGAEQPRPVAEGEPLPAGAVARLGTARLRHGHSITGLAFSADGKTLFSGSWDRTLSQWDVATGKEVRRFEGHTAWVRCIALSPDGKTLASGAEDFRLWDVATGKELHRAPVPAGDVWGVAFSPDGKLVACTLSLSGAGGKGGALVVEAATGKPVLQVAGHTDFVRAVAFAPDGKLLATAGNDGTVRLWDAATGRETARLEGHANIVACVAFAPDGRSLASGGADGSVRLWDPQTGKELAKIDADQGVTGVPCLAFAPDGKRLAVGAAGRRAICLYDLASGKELHALPGGWFRCVAFAPDGKTVAGGDGHQAVRLWDPVTGKLLQPADGHEAGVHGVALSPDGRTVAAGTYLRTIYLWDLPTGRPLRRLEGHEHGVYPVVFAPDGKTLASGSRDGTARVWDATTGRQLHVFRAYDGEKRGDVWVYGLAFSPDGKLLAGACRDGFVRVWDLETGKERYRCEGHGAYVWGVAFLPDGKSLVSAGDDGAVRLWETETGQLLRVLGEQPFRVESVTVSPDGRLVAAGGRDGTVRLLDVATGRQVQQLKEHPNAAFRARLFRDGRTLAFSPDGRTVASGSWQVVQLWEVATGQERCTFPAHRGEVTATSFFPDGRRLVTGSPDTTALIWDLAACAGGRAAARPTAAERDALWADLTGEDAVRAYRALWALAAVPDDALPLLRAHLHPAPAPDRQRLAALLKDLDSDEFAVREAATAELEKRGEAAEPFLRQTLKEGPSPEVRQRVEHLLGKLRGALPAERLREARALELLEHLPAPEARPLLEALAQGAPEARLTQETRTALQRLARQAKGGTP